MSFINIARLQAALEDRNVRLDAGETAALARQLEHVYARTYDIKYAELKARKFIPVGNDVDPGADFFVYRQWDMFGMAEIIANYAMDLPRVDALAKEFTSPIKSLGASYGYSIQDLRRAAKTGSQLDERRARAARRAHEQAVDNIAAFGNTTAGLPGFTNNSNVPLVTPDNAPWDGGAVTALQIVADMNKLVNAIVSQTKETFVPDTLLLDTHSFEIINTRPMSTTGDSSMTILRFFLETNPYIKNIDQWNRLNDAGAAGVTRLIAYPRSNEVCELVIPQEFEQFPPQAKNLEFTIPTHSRIGGVRIMYPLAMAYMDGTGE